MPSGHEKELYTIDIHIYTSYIYTGIHTYILTYIYTYVPSTTNVYYDARTIIK
jgi:hypothetical protein